MKSKPMNKGFTLIEMILSIGILAILAVGVLRLFVVSQVNHQKAVDIDLAVLECNALIERTHSLEDITESGNTFVFYYDNEWKNSIQKDVFTQYAMYGTISSLPNNLEGLFNLALRVVRLNPYPLEKDGEKELYQVSVLFENRRGGEGP